MKLRRMIALALAPDLRSVTRQVDEARTLVHNVRHDFEGLGFWSVRSPGEPRTDSLIALDLVEAEALLDQAVSELTGRKVR